MNLIVVSFLNLNNMNNIRKASIIDFKSIKYKGLDVNNNNIDKTKGQNGGLHVADSETISEFVSEYTLKSAIFLAIIK